MNGLVVGWMTMRSLDSARVFRVWGMLMPSHAPACQFAVMMIFISKFYQMVDRGLVKEISNRAFSDKHLRWTEFLHPFIK